jgi:L-threonylcarbamoyladenylate synthase
MPCPVGADVELAAKIISEGGLVAFATETVYGLGANGLDPIAVARVFEAKNRPQFDPLICHLSSREEINKIAINVPDIASVLAERFWPGPLTMVLPKKEIVPDLVTSGLKTVGIRVPKHPLARKLIELAGVPIAAPSANLFGKVSPTTAQHVADQLGDRIDYILDGGPSEIGLESTVIDCSAGTVKVLRLGGLTNEELESVVDSIEMAKDSDHPQDKSQTSPGQLPQHYAPTTKLIVEGIPKRPLNVSRIGILSLSSPKNIDDFDAVEILSETNNLKEAAAKFFTSLRLLDEKNLDCIIAVPFPEVGLGRALNDRLIRAVQKG